jgi:hypothetical protein
MVGTVAPAHQRGAGFTPITQFLTKNISCQLSSSVANAAQTEQLKADIERQIMKCNVSGPKKQNIIPSVNIPGLTPMKLSNFRLLILSSLMLLLTACGADPEADSAAVASPEASVLLGAPVISGGAEQNACPLNQSCEPAHRIMDPDEITLALQHQAAVPTTAGEQAAPAQAVDGNPVTAEFERSPAVRDEAGATP